MPQIQLPIFPEGVTRITGELGFACQDGRVTYFTGHMPVFVHDKDDIQTFRMITSQFIVNGNATQSEISKAFGVPKGTVKRYCKLYREKGPSGFYEPHRTRGPSVLTPEVLAQVQAMLDEGHDVPHAALEFGLKANTLHKAIRAGRLHQAVKKSP